MAYTPANQKGLIVEMFPGIEAQDLKPQNPCIALHGPGPEGKQCKTCKHLLRWKYSKTYLKCEMREVNHKPRTDHRATYPACGKYEE